MAQARDPEVVNRFPVAPCWEVVVEADMVAMAERLVEQLAPMAMEA